MTFILVVVVAVVLTFVEVALTVVADIKVVLTFITVVALAVGLTVVLDFHYAGFQMLLDIFILL